VSDNRDIETELRYVLVNPTAKAIAYLEREMMRRCEDTSLHPKFAFLLAIGHVLTAAFEDCDNAGKIGIAIEIINDVLKCHSAPARLIPTEALQ
jgi:hypothetical protein